LFLLKENPKRFINGTFSLSKLSPVTSLLFAATDDRSETYVKPAKKGKTQLKLVLISKPVYFTSFLN